MKAISCNQRNGEHRKSLCPGTTQDPTQYQRSSLTLGLNIQSIWLHVLLVLSLNEQINKHGAFCGVN